MPRPAEGLRVKLELMPTARTSRIATASDAAAKRRLAASASRLSSGCAGEVGSGRSAATGSNSRVADADPTARLYSMTRGKGNARATRR